MMNVHEQHFIQCIFVVAHLYSESRPFNGLINVENGSTKYGKVPFSNMMQIPKEKFTLLLHALGN